MADQMSRHAHRPIPLLFAIAGMAILNLQGTSAANARHGVFSLQGTSPANARHGVSSLHRIGPANARHVVFGLPGTSPVDPQRGFFSLQGIGPVNARSVFRDHPSWPGVCSVFSRHPCAPTVCSVFQREPCVPEIEYPIDQDLRLTIVSAVSDVKADRADAAAGARADTSQGLSTLSDMFDALRACWIPPPDDEARPGMQMTVRFSFRGNGEIISPPRVTYKSPDAPPETTNTYHDAITAALDRCTPMPFTTGLGGAVAGRPIAIRFVDDRTRK
jgi:hypothetical protein